MKNSGFVPQKILITVFLAIFTIILSLPYSAYAVEGKKDIYDPSLNVKAEIQKALQQCEKNNTHVLLIFGGNWCPWCHRLHELLKSDPAIAKFLDKHFVLIMVDVGEKPKEPLNRDLVDLYRVKDMGYPSLAVLGKKGELLCSQNSGILEKGKGHDPERVMGFLKANAPAPEVHK